MQHKILIQPKMKYYLDSSKPMVVTAILVYSLDSLTVVWGSTLLTLTLSSLKITQTTIGIMTIAAILVRFCRDR